MKRFSPRAKTLLLAFLLLALFFLYGGLFYPHPAGLPSGGSLEAPSFAHWLGTDDLGVDLYAQLSAGFFSSMAVGLAAAAFAFLLGGLAGVLAGLSSGAADALFSFLIQLFLSLPQLPVMVVIGAFFGQSAWNIILIVSLFSWAPIAKVLRARVRQIRGRPYLRLAESYGGRAGYLVSAHMLGELLPLLSVSALSVVGKAIVQEASLAYLGLSDPLSRSWGLLIQKCVSFPGIYFTPYWKWWLLPPVFALVLTVLCLRLFSRELETIWRREESDAAGA
ncbi:ABC transporter permease [Oscillospiraceae bacterium BX1]|uniref:ABC transporter permease n=2 Tax=Yanshouia hominis TaxID=2763673 RepID=A0ABR7NI98_9FIRM|nr:ABC transporter permease [Yanshouia hominis]